MTEQSVKLRKFITDQVANTFGHVRWPGVISTPESKDRIFVKGYGFLSFTKNMGKYFGKNIRTWVVNIARNFMTKLKKYATDRLKTTSKSVIQKTAEATGDLIGNNIADKIAEVSKNSQQNNSETVTYEPDQEIPT